MLLYVSGDLHDVKMIRFSAVFEGGRSLPRDASLAPEEAGEGTLPWPAVPLHEANEIGPRFTSPMHIFMGGTLKQEDREVSTACSGLLWKGSHSKLEYPMKLTYFGSNFYNGVIRV